MKTLLLNGTYECISFISMRNALKLYFNNKTEILSNWDEEISWCNGSMKLPAVMRLKYRVRFLPRTLRFNRSGIFKRDKYTCAYCGKTKITLTIDHIIPKARGGTNTWMNTTASCLSCNLAKGNRTPEEAGMLLLFRPFVPYRNLSNDTITMNKVHEDWKLYLI